MAFGAPDGVRLSDTNLLQYDDVIYQTLARNIPPFVNSDLVNITGIGCLGAVDLVFADHNSVLYVYLDGTMRFFGKPLDMKNFFGIGPSVQSTQFGVAKYDDVNDRFSIWFDADYKMWFKKSLWVFVYNGAGAIQNIKYVRVTYKLRS